MFEVFSHKCWCNKATSSRKLKKHFNKSTWIKTEWPFLLPISGWQEEQSLEWLAFKNRKTVMIYALLWPWNWTLKFTEPQNEQGLLPGAARSLPPPSHVTRSEDIRIRFQPSLWPWPCNQKLPQKHSSCWWYRVWLQKVQKFKRYRTNIYFLRISAHTVTLALRIGTQTFRMTLRVSQCPRKSQMLKLWTGPDALTLIIT